MDFIYLFDLLNFGENGQVIATNSCDLNQARENYVYLLSKYNQKFLKIKGLETPEFFKAELPHVLKSVREGGEEEFESAKKAVCAYSVDYVKEIVEKAKSEVETIQVLNRLLAMKDRSFFSNEKLAGKIRSAINNKQITYTLMSCANEYFGKVAMIQANSATERKEMFSYVINYNTLSTMAVMVEKGGLTKDKLVGKNDSLKTEFEQTFSNQYVAARTAGGAGVQC